MSLKMLVERAIYLLEMCNTMTTGAAHQLTVLWKHCSRTTMAIFKDVTSTVLTIFEVIKISLE